MKSYNLRKLFRVIFFASLVFFSTTAGLSNLTLPINHPLIVQAKSDMAIRKKAAGSQAVTLELIGEYQTVAAANDLDVHDQIVYIAEGGGGVEIVNAGNPTTPTLLTYIPISANVIDVVGGRAYLGDPGLKIIDVSVPATYTLLGGLPSQCINKIEVVGLMVYAICSDMDGSFDVIDVSVPAQPRLRGSQGIFVPTNLRINGDFAFVTLANDFSFLGWLRVLDISNPDTIETNDSKGYYYMGFGPFDVEGKTVYSFASGGKYGPLYLLDIDEFDDTGHLVFQSSRELPSAITAMDSVGGLLYVTTADGKFQVFVTQYPKNISELLIENIPWDVRDIQVVGNRIYLATGVTGLKILRIDYPYQMFLPFISASE